MEKNNPRIIRAWTFYDWANSVYPLVITSALFPVFYENITRGSDGSDLVEVFSRSFRNSELYSYVVSISFMIVVVLSPILSGIADYSGNKKRFLQFFCYLGAFASASLFFFDPEHLGLSMVSVLLASLGYWGSLVFYNAFLPEIADPEHHDKISARGFSLGYLGSALLLIFCLVFIMNPHWLGYENAGMLTRWSFVLVGVWWIGFAQITYRRLPNNVYRRKANKDVIFNGFKELKSVWLQLKETKRLRAYLLSFFVFSMGVQTVMLMAVLFAKKEIPGLESKNLIISVLLIQFVGILGASSFARLSKGFGNLKALGLALFIWIGICVGTYFFVHTPVDFYIVAGVVGLVMGGIQALARSTYSKMLPETKDHASFFSFFDITEKLAIVIGTASFGFIEGLTGSMRNSILALIVFFILGFVLLLRIPKTKVLDS